MASSRTRKPEGAPDVDSGTFPHAVRFTRFERIAFLAVPIPEQLRDALHELGGQVLDGVTLVEDEDAYDWPEGAEAPAPVLAVSRREPTHYVLFKRAEDVDRESYEPTGMSHAVYHNAAQFAAFVDALRRLDRIAGHTDETDTDERWDQIIRNLSRADTPGTY